MVKISIEALRSLMDNPHNIRNFSVVAHVDHGKSTLTDSLLYSNEIISKNDVGNKRGLDDRDDEMAKGITIKSSGVTLHYEVPKELVRENSLITKHGREFLINLIDSPGHVDFSSEVTAALRLTDGALVLVDCVEGCAVQTEIVLRQALAERVKPVLAINKLDRAFLELQLEPEEMYRSFHRNIENVNINISTFQDDTMGDLTVHPEKGTVCFSAGRQGWAFTLNQFARMYAKKYGVNEETMMERLWGDHFFDPESKKWVTKPETQSGKTLPRGFCQYVIAPIGQIFKACKDSDWKVLDPILTNLNIPLTQQERSATGKDLIKNIMMKWLPASNAILDMIANHLPSPVVAQRYRVEKLYTGPLDDETARAIRDCDPNGPLVMYVSKMIPNRDQSRFYAFGRVFSGTVSCQKVRIMGANHIYGSKEDLAVNRTVQGVNIVMGGKTEAVDSVPCGNTCALVGIDNFLVKSGTVTTLESSYPLVNMKYSVSPVYKVAVSTKNPVDLPKLVNGLKMLAKSDGLLQIASESNGEFTIAGAGDLHLEISLNELRNFMKGIELVVSKPVVPYQETVTAESIRCLAKSPNSHNRIFANACPISNDLTEAIISKEISAQQDAKVRATKLIEYGWDLSESRKIWGFGPEANPCNVLVDMTKGIQFLNEVKESVMSGFQNVVVKGILAEEPMRGVRFNILDAMLHSDTIHRGIGQIMPASRSVMIASQLTAKPRLLEPIYMVDISCPSTSLGGVFNVLNQKRGQMIESVPKVGSLYQIKAYLPVAESFNFSGVLREATSGQAFPQMFFDHWAIVDSDPLQNDTKASEIVKEIRIRKGLEINIPPLERFLDKL